MAKSPSKAGTTLTVSLTALAIGAMTVASALSLSSTRTSFESEAVEVDITELEVELIRAKLDPESLCVAGVTAAETTTIVNNARAYLALNLATLRTAEAQLASTRIEHDRLTRLLRSGQASPSDVTDFENNEPLLATRQAALDSLQDDFYSEATDNLVSQDKLTALGYIQDAGRWACPVQYKCANRSESDWVTLRDALANERISDELGDDPDPTLQQFLATVHAENGTSSAIARLQTSLSSIQAAFSDALLDD